MTTSADSRAAKLQTSFQELAVAAGALNQSSDLFGGATNRVDAALANLNLGVTAWVCFSTDRDPDAPQYHAEEQLGYAKVGNRRGLALRIVEFDDLNGDDEVKDVWLFGDAPRELRLRAIDHVPDLIDALVKETKETAKRVSKKVDVAVDLAAQIEKFAEKGGQK